MGKKRNWLLIMEIRKGGGIQSIRSFATDTAAFIARGKLPRSQANRSYIVKRSIWEKKF